MQGSRDTSDLEKVTECFKKSSSSRKPPPPAVKDISSDSTLMEEALTPNASDRVFS